MGVGLGGGLEAAGRAGRPLLNLALAPAWLLLPGPGERGQEPGAQDPAAHLCGGGPGGLHQGALPVLPRAGRGGERKGGAAGGPEQGKAGGAKRVWVQTEKGTWGRGREGWGLKRLPGRQPGEASPGRKGDSLPLALSTAAQPTSRALCPGLRDPLLDPRKDDEVPALGH